MVQVLAYETWVLSFYLFIIMYVSSLLCTHLNNSSKFRIPNSNPQFPQFQFFTLVYLVIIIIIIIIIQYLFNYFI